MKCARGLPLMWHVPTSRSERIEADSGLEPAATSDDMMLPNLAVGSSSWEGGK